MLEDVRKYVEAAFESLNPARARELAGQMTKGQPVEQVNRAAKELLGWSQRSRERIIELVQAEVKRQLKSVGIATRDDLDTLRARVRELERSGSTRAGGTRKPARKSAAKKKSASRKSPSKKSAARKSSSRTRSRPQGNPDGSSSSSGAAGAQGSSG